MPGGGGGKGSEGKPNPLAPADLERIIHRAAELQFGETTSGGEALSDEEVLRIGKEVGVPEHHLRRALSEFRAAARIPAPPTDRQCVRRLVGGAVLRSSRAVPGDPEALQERVEHHLRERESLAEVRRRSGYSLWEPAGGVRAQLQRAFDWEGRGYQLAKIPALELTVAGLEEGWSLVHLTADLRSVRAEHAWGWSLSLLAGAVPFTFLAGVVGPLAVPAAAGLGVGGALGGSIWATRATFRARRDRIRLSMDGLLDRLERDDPLDRSRSRG